LVNFGKERQVGVNSQENIDRFREHYGIPPAAAAPFLNDFKEKYPDVRYTECLMTMYWLKVYGTERQLSGVWTFSDLQYIRDTVKSYTKLMASMEEDVIIFGGFGEEIHCFGIDGIHFTTTEFRLNPSSEWYNFKNGGAGLKYEFAMAIYRPAIVSRRGPFPASVHDITIFRGGTADVAVKDRDQDALYFRMEQLGGRRKGVGDSGYAGEPTKIVTTNSFQPEDYREFLKRVKDREESLHIRLRAYNVLENRFRHGSGTEDKQELHGACVGAITVMTQYDFHNGRPPFQPR
jgi:hypothetical protein